MKRAISLFITITLLFVCIDFAPNIAKCEEDSDLLEYAELTEPSDLEQIENAVQSQLKDTLGNEYRIDVQAYFESKEAIEEGEYNSRESEYFGYLLSEVDAHFEGIPYVFTVGENGETVVTEFKAYNNPWEKILKNVAIGTGVIVVCVTLSHLTVAAAPALHLIFACAAETAKTWAIRGIGIGALKSGILSYLQTGDLETAFMDALYGASEGYKWGAIGGAVTGGAAKTINLASLKHASGLTMNEVATIQQSGLFSDATIKNIHSMDEYNLYKDANLVEYNINGRTIMLPKDINPDFVDPSTGLTNRELVANHLNPVDSNGIKYDMHHVGQKTDSPIAFLTQDQHHGNHEMLHPAKVSTVRPNGDNSMWLKDKRELLSIVEIIFNQFF